MRRTRDPVYRAVTQLSSGLGCLWERTVWEWECLQVTWHFTTSSSASTPIHYQCSVITTFLFHNPQPHTFWDELSNTGPWDAVKIRSIRSIHSKWNVDADEWLQLLIARCLRTGAPLDPPITISLILIHSGKNSNQISCSLNTRDSEGQLYLFSQEFLNLRSSSWG